MNHLAHFHLSFGNPDLVVGNWLADHVRQPEVARFSEAVQHGIYLHRKIDRFSDEHERMREAAARLRPFLGKYAPVFVDIFNDHLLAISWADWSDESLSDFSQKTYSIIESRIEELPTVLRLRTEKMIAADWLNGYQSMEGMEFVLYKFKERMAGNEFFQKAQPDLDGALQFFMENRESFLEGFNPFYRELIEAVKPPH